MGGRHQESIEKGQKKILMCENLSTKQAAVQTVTFQHNQTVTHQNKKTRLVELYLSDANKPQAVNKTLVS